MPAIQLFISTWAKSYEDIYHSPPHGGVHRKDCKQVLQVKKDLKDLTADDLDLPRGTKIFVNQSLCPYYRILWSKTKRLQSMGKINSFFISGRTVKIKIDKNSKPLAITHLDDLAINFPGVDLSPSPKAS